MNLQRLLSLTRQAADDYHMIESGDKIAVGVSGGKDSLTLLYALHGLKRFYPIPFEIIAMTVDLGFADFDLGAVKSLCNDLSIEYMIIPSKIGKILFETRKEKNPCALCAKMRKGALNQAAKSVGCSKIAYAHHRDDLIETMLLSLIYEGRFYAFSPKMYLDRTELTVIRPLIYVEESDVIRFKNHYQLPVCKNPCPVDGKTKRQYVKNLTNQLNLDAPGVKERFFHSIIEGNIGGWPEKHIKAGKGDNFHENTLLS